MTKEQFVLGIALVFSMGFIGLLNLLPRFGKSGVSPGRKFLAYLIYLWQKRQLKDGGIWLGQNWISDNARLRHTHIVGSTGCGKSVLMEHLIAKDIERGFGLMIIDPKGDRELFNRVRALAERAGRLKDLVLLSAERPDESAIWNPCGFGDVSQLQTKFYNACTYAEPHYAKAVELGLLSIFQTLLKRHSAGFGLTEVVHELSKRRKENKDDATEGLYLDLQSLYQSEWQNVLTLEPNSISCDREVSILDIVLQGKILFIDLPTESKAIQSKRIGKLILSEIVNVSGFFKSHPEEKPRAPFSVYVDEFDAFATEAFSTFLNKGRSSNFMIHLAHQTLADLREVSETFQDKVMGNINVRFIFRQDNPADAEKWSEVFGTSKVEINTYRVENGSKTGDASLRLGHEFKVSPNLIKHFGVGRCLYSSKEEKILQEIKVPRPLELFSNLREEKRKQDPKRFRRSFHFNSLPTTTRSDDEAPASGDVDRDINK